MPSSPLPVSCPQCGERQNQLAPGFDLDRKPFGGASCMVCRHVFTESEYRQGLARSRRDLERRISPGLRQPS